MSELSWVDQAALDTNAALEKKQNRSSRRYNLYRLRWLRPLIENRWSQLVVRILLLSGFVFTIASGLFGSLVGSHNFAIIFVWIAWWTALKLVFIPFGGRSWCSVCPIPLPGDWLQQGGVLVKSSRGRGLNLRWPARLKGSWLQTGSFLLIGMFSALTLTDPRITGWVLLALFVLAAALSLTFEKRAFCSYICPIGGFSGMYAQASPVEVRVIEKDICTRHEVKSCYQACPWGLYPVAFQNSAACGLCMECLRACPSDNLALNLRPFGTDLGRNRTTSRLDETFLALVMLGSVITFAAVFTGPWGWLKNAAFAIGSLQWVGYASTYLVLCLLLLPGLFTLAVWAGQKYAPARRTLKQEIAAQAHVLLPLGLMAWIAFTVSFAFPKLNLIASVANDPFGWGWNLLGSIDTYRILDISSFSTLLQVSLLMLGLFWSARISHRLSAAGMKSISKGNIPVLAFSLLFTFVMLWLLVG